MYISYVTGYDPIHVGKTVTVCYSLENLYSFTYISFRILNLNFSTIIILRIFTVI